MVGYTLKTSQKLVASTNLMAPLKVRTSFLPSSEEHLRPLSLQLRQGMLASHFIRYVRHQTHARDTCCLFGRTLGWLREAVVDALVAGNCSMMPLQKLLRRNHGLVYKGKHVATAEHAGSLHRIFEAGLVIAVYRRIRAAQCLVVTSQANFERKLMSGVDFCRIYTPEISASR